MKDLNILKRCPLEAIVSMDHKPTAELVMDFPDVKVIDTIAFQVNLVMVRNTGFYDLAKAVRRDRVMRGNDESVSFNKAICIRRRFIRPVLALDFDQVDKELSVLYRDYIRGNDYGRFKGHQWLESLNGTRSVVETHSGEEGFILLIKHELKKTQSLLLKRVKPLSVKCKAIVKMGSVLSMLSATTTPQENYLNDITLTYKGSYYDRQTNAFLHQLTQFEKLLLKK